MSMSRVDAIRHFSAAKYSSTSIAAALAAAPAAVRNGLAVADHAWVKRWADVPAHEAVARLHARSLANPDGTQARLAAGRPPMHSAPMRRVNVMLDAATIERATRLGDGNLSAGLRRAVRAA